MMLQRSSGVVTVAERCTKSLRCFLGNVISRAKGHLKVDPKNFGTELRKGLFSHVIPNLGSWGFSSMN